MGTFTFVFDYDGTLCDTLDAISSSLLATFREYAPETPDIGRITALIGTGKTLQETIRELHPAPASLDDATLKVWVDFYRAEYNRSGEAKVVLFDGVIETLDALRAHGRLVLLSNKGIQAVENSLKRFGIHDRFDLVLAEEAGQPKKPDPAVFVHRIAPRMSDVVIQRTVVIGDTAADLEFARNIGAIGCYARYGYGEPAVCEAIGYAHRIDRVPDMIDLFASHAKENTLVEAVV